MPSIQPISASTEIYNHGFSCIHVSPVRMEKLHQHNEVELGFLQQGAIHMQVGQRAVGVPLRRLSVLWGLVPHGATHTEVPNSYLSLNIPLLWFLQLNLPSEFNQALLNGRMVFEPSEDFGAEDELLFRRWRADFQQDASAARDIIMLEVEARLRRLVKSLGEMESLQIGSEPSMTASTEAELGQAERMARHIAEHYQLDLRVADIAACAGIHPDYAMRLFRRAFGVTILHNLTQHRIWHAQRLLSTTDAKMHEVADKAGFGSVSQFHEVFKRVCGTSPRSYRATLIP